MNQQNNQIQRLVGTGVLAATIIVLQIFASNFRVGTFNITLALIPIIIGGIVYGPIAGAILGAVFGVMVNISVVTGMDVGGFAFFQAKPAMTLLVCMAKSTIGGGVAGFIYQILAGKNKTLAAAAAAFICPILNTGILALSMITIFKEVVMSWIPAGETQSVLIFVIFGILGINFLVELAINIILIPVVLRIATSIRRIR